MVIVRGWGRRKGNRELLFRGYGATAGENEEVLKTDDGDG